MSVGLNRGALLGGLVYLLFSTQGWPFTTSLVPRIVTGTAIVAVGLSLINSVFRGGAHAASALDDAKAQASTVLHMDIVEDNEGLSNGEILTRALRFGGWLLMFLLSMATIGIIPTIPLFVIGFMRLEGNERWSLVLPMALGLTLFVYGVFDQLLGMVWPQTFMGAWFPVLEIIPSL